MKGVGVGGAAGGAVVKETNLLQEGSVYSAGSESTASRTLTAAGRASIECFRSENSAFSWERTALMGSAPDAGKLCW